MKYCPIIVSSIAWFGLQWTERAKEPTARSQLQLFLLSSPCWIKHFITWRWFSRWTSSVCRGFKLSLLHYCTLFLNVQVSINREGTLKALVFLSPLAGLIKRESLGWLHNYTYVQSHFESTYDVLTCSTIFPSPEITLHLLLAIATSAEIRTHVCGCTELRPGPQFRQLSRFQLLLEQLCRLCFKPSITISRYLQQQQRQHPISLKTSHFVHPEPVLV